MDRRAWWATLHGVTKSRRQLSDSFSLSHLLLKAFTSGNSLGVQCLGIHTFTAEGSGSTSGWRTKIPQVMWLSQKKKKQNRHLLHSSSESLNHTWTKGQIMLSNYLVLPGPQQCPVAPMSGCGDLLTRAPVRVQCILWDLNIKFHRVSNLLSGHRVCQSWFSLLPFIFLPSR